MLEIVPLMLLVISVTNLAPVTVSCMLWVFDSFPNFSIGLLDGNGNLNALGRKYVGV